MQSHTDAVVLPCPGKGTASPLKYYFVFTAKLMLAQPRFFAVLGKIATKCHLGGFTAEHVEANSNLWLYPDLPEP